MRRDALSSLLCRTFLRLLLTIFKCADYNIDFEIYTLQYMPTYGFYDCFEEILFKIFSSEEK